LPFTLAHPAAILPLRKPLGRWAAVSALAIGSVMPDFAYFLPFGPTRPESHSLAGLFTFCLPFGLLVYAAFHLLVAPLGYALAPSPLRGRLGDDWREGRLPRAGAVAVILSLPALPVLGEPLFTLAGYTVRRYTLLQHGSTLLGISVLATWFHRWYVRTPWHRPIPALQSSLLVRAGILGLILLPPVVLGLAAGVRHLRPELGALASLRRFLWYGVVSGGWGLIASLFVAGTAWRVFLIASRADTRPKAG